MPPCGYRIPAIDGISQFLLDNLDYFIDLYQAKGLPINKAIEVELEEIARIRRGERGGAWSAIVVEMNAHFYKLLRAEGATSWEEVSQIGRSIVASVIVDLQSLTVVAKSHEGSALDTRRLGTVAGL